MVQKRIFAILIFCFCLVVAACEKLPDSDSVKYLPEYYDEYLDGRVNAINNAIAESDGNCETFFWITDMHWEPDLNARQSPAMIKYIASKTGINKILNGGDTGNANVICENAIARLRDAVGSNMVYTVTGNHEITDASKYEKPLLRVSKSLRGHAGDLVYGDSEKSYFYFDNDVNKIRYIGLSVFGEYRDGGCESALNHTQLAWFKDVALDVNEGWIIVIFAHALYSVSGVSDKLYESLSGASDFIDAIDSYRGKGKIVCVLLGHSHRDRIHIGKSGVPYVISACDRYSPHYTDGISDINVQRTLGTITEQHFEVVVVDRKYKRVRLFSIGAQSRDGYDNESGSLVEERIIAY